MKKQQIFISAGLILGAAWIAFWIPKGAKSFEGIKSLASISVNQGESCDVVPGSVYDGDTLEVRCAGKQTKVRLCGIDAPEIEQPLGIKSRDKLRELLKGGRVEFYAIEQDRYGRTVAELAVTTGDPKEIFVNEKIVSLGMAYHYAKYSGNCPNKAAIEAAEEVARTGKFGVWRTAGAVKPWDYRKTQN